MRSGLPGAGLSRRSRRQGCCLASPVKEGGDREADQGDWSEWRGGADQEPEEAERDRDGGRRAGVAAQGDAGRHRRDEDREASDGGEDEFARDLRREGDAAAERSAWSRMPGRRCVTVPGDFGAVSAAPRWSSEPWTNSAGSTRSSTTAHAGWRTSRSTRSWPRRPSRCPARTSSGCSRLRAGNSPAPVRTVGDGRGTGVAGVRTAARS
jgi:hypothetical protein